ncbi:prolyl oligopeptidase family serine peptidase [Pseudobythopirellula maris]|uniref:prolyl oligopeptidase family serine peptidase n=1 Tax=Pseudobythopirellula maris TaxID=2527991 RepID=UPI0018D31845|nr:prolyl oligopeptidase family serine peptidase [Pseudobythopirellula maris]
MAIAFALTLAPANNALAASASNEQASGEAASASDTSGAEASDRPPVLGDGPLVLRDYWVTPSVGDYRRGPLHRDPIEAQLARGDWPEPGASGAEGRPGEWRRIETGPEGEIAGADLMGGYALATIESPDDRVVLLKAARHAAVCVEGAWHVGDPYARGDVDVPIRLAAGRNRLLFHLVGAGFSASLEPAGKNATLCAAGAVLPDLVRGETLTNGMASLTLVNASDQRLTDLELLATVVEDANEAQGEATSPVSHPVPSLESLARTPVRLRLPTIKPAEGMSEVRVRIDLVQARGARQDADNDDAEASARAVLATETVALRVAGAGEPIVRTFVSELDDSLQPYTVVPPAAPIAEGERPGVVLALHDAGQSSHAFAKLCTPKPWAYTVCPQGRGDYGFDWEDWAAADALEALDHFLANHETDERRVSVAGHGMGGHGAWLLGVTHPGRFAAVAPSAGWVSFRTYGGASLGGDPSTPMLDALTRGVAPGEVDRLLTNLERTAVAVVHGAEDRVVSPAESRYLRGRLGEFHPNFLYHEPPGVGHDAARTCELPAAVDLMRRARLDADPDQLDYTTLDPGAVGGSDWARIESQVEALTPSRVVLRRDPKGRSISGRTTNVARMSLDLSGLEGDGPVRVRIDGKTVPVPKTPGSGRLWLAQQDARGLPSPGEWRVYRPNSRLKHSGRSGGFKSVFDHRPLLVYGTRGTAEENRWAEAKARYDAQLFAYRGAGSLEVAPDVLFNPYGDRTRSVVLYGNADTNAAWRPLLGGSPVRVERGRVDVGPRPEMGDDLAVLMVRPRPGSRNACVAVVGGTGVVGMRMTNRLRYFWSGVAYPDLMIYGPETLVDGVGDVRAAGRFSNDWSVGPDIVWRDLAL